MKRRNMLLGLGAATVGGSTLLGSGAFSRVESHRDVTIEVAEDPSAYLGLDGTGSINSDNYVSIDENGHLAITVDEHDDFEPTDNAAPGTGVNSDSFTYFDSMVEVCNQGKEGVGFYIEELKDADLSNVDATDSAGDPRLQFYTGEAAGEGDSGTSSVMGSDNAVDIPLGECIELGLRTNTKGVNASDDTGIDQLIAEEDEVTLVADVDVEQPLTGRNQPVRNSRTGAGYPSIQQAVIDAEEGDTIEAGAGTYSESVEIDVEGLTLEGAGTGSTTVDASGKERGLDIKSDGVTVRGLTVDAAGSDVENGEVEGIFIGNANGFTDNGGTIAIKNVDITEVDGAGTGKTTEGIHIKHYDAGDPINGVDIENVTIDTVAAPSGAWGDGGRGANGIKLQANVKNIEIKNSTEIKNINGGWGYGVVLTGSSVEAGTPTNISFSDVTVSNINVSGPYSSIGIGIDSSSGDPVSPENGSVPDPDELSFENTVISSVDIGLVNKNTSKELSAPSGVSFSEVDTEVGNPDGDSN